MSEPRLVMLETIREYAAERLEGLPEFSASARRAHALYFADFAQLEWERLTRGERDAALAAWPPRARTCASLGATGSPSVISTS